MSLILYGNGVVDARGSVGGTTLSRSRGGASQRAKISPTQTRSPARQQAKMILNNISQQWGNVLSAGQRAAWNAFAIVNPSTNVFGQVTYLSGHMWFCKCNMNLANANVAAVLTPPLTASVPGPLSMSITSAHGPGSELIVTYDNTGSVPNNYVNIYASPPLSQGIAYCNNQFRKVVFSLDTGSPLNASSFYKPKFPGIVYSAGKQVFCLVNFMDGDSGVTSPGLIATAVIT